MITVQFTRDELRSMQHYFFSYLDMLTTMKERQENDLEGKMMEHIVKDQFNQVRRLIEKKLFNKGNKIKLQLEDTQAIIMYKLFMNFPIDQDNVILQMLRNLYCKILYEAITKVLTMEKIKQPVETG